MKTHLFANRYFLKVALLVSLVFLKTTLTAQVNKTYATSQTNSVSAICLLCGVQNPQNAVDNDENTYSTLTMNVGLLANVQQTLYFPSLSEKMIVIGIEGDITMPLLNGKVFIETMNDNISNGDSRTVDPDIVNGNPPNRSTIEFRPSKPFNRVKITLKAEVAGLTLFRELKIYYAYASDLTTPCGVIPANPYVYYSFNGNTNNELNTYGDPKLINKGENLETYQDGLVCNQALIGTNKFESNRIIMTRYDPTLIPPYIPYFNDPNDSKKTISFWASVEDYLDLEILYRRIVIRPNSIQFGSSSIVNAPTYNSFRQLNHYTLVYDPINMGTLKLYLNGILQIPTYTPVNAAVIFVGGGIGIDMKNAKIDELLVYNTVLSAATVKELACSYNILQNCASGNPAMPVSVVKASPAEDLFTVSPNPTTGQITLDGNILLLDAAISIRNTSGMEVYQSSFRTKTFDLPATLPGGVYFLTLQTKDKKIYIRKIILTR